MPRLFDIRRLPLALAAALAVPAAGAAPANEAPGIALVTTVSGPVRLVDADGRSQEPKLHRQLELGGTRIENDRGAFLCLALSNGIGLGLGEESSLAVEAFRQAPFPENKESLFYEPSTSILSIGLERGTISVASDHLSPLSELRIQLPFGQVRVHSAVCVVALDSSGLHLTVFQGHLTYTYPNGEDREFVSSGQRVRISPSGAERRRIAELLPADTAPEAWKTLGEATLLAAKRVLFEAAPEGAPYPAQPVVIVRPDYYEQATRRPYEYLD